MDAATANPARAEIAGTWQQSDRGRAAYSAHHPLAYRSTAGDWRAWYQGPLKCLWNSKGDHALDDLVEDPEAQRNLYAEPREQADRLGTALEALRSLGHTNQWYASSQSAFRTQRNAALIPSRSKLSG
jgi:hypothetical protein